MSSLVRWDPFVRSDPLSNAMDRLFENALAPVWRRPGIPGVDAAMDMYETDDSIVVKVSAPGVKPEDVQVSVVGDTLTIRGEFKSEEKVENGQYLCRELARGQFVRSLTLPGVVQADNANAEFENGILTIAIPKAEEAKPKVVKITSK
jgi:HSP20 family protein